MELIKAFLVNISILTAFAYLINLLYKYVLAGLSKSTKVGLSVVVFILAGWLAMCFAIEISTGSRFDLRNVPLIFGLMLYRRPAPLIIIGVGIGLLRLTFGIDESAWIGLFITSLLGVEAALLRVWFNKRPDIPYLRKAVIAVLGINIFHAVGIALFGVTPPHRYLTEIAPITFPLGVLLGFFFLLMIRDFQLNQQRMRELSRTNRLLRARTQDLDAANNELEKRAEQLQTASRFKSEFLANMSHELKTPLNSILMLSQMQDEDETHEEDRRRFAKMIHQSGRDLLTLVDDILDLTKVEVGKLDVVEQPVELVELLRQMEEQFRPLADSRKLGFRAELRAAPGQWLLTDPLRLNQILRNLLGNAFKFTERGEVALAIAEESGTGEDEGAIVFQVSDTGVGIDPDKQELVFEVFRQADGSINRKYGGSGLGLTISRQLAELLGGKLELRSEKGVGSTFTLRLPVRRPETLPKS